MNSIKLTVTYTTNAPLDIKLFFNAPLFTTAYLIAVFYKKQKYIKYHISISYVYIDSAS